MICLPPPLRPTTTTTTETKSKPKRNPKPNSNTINKSPITPSPEEIYLSKSTHLTLEEVLRRRSHRLKQLAKCYRDYYWSLMEELKVQYGDYVWKYGLSPFQEDQDEKEKAKDSVQDDIKIDVIEVSGETNNNPNATIVVNNNNNNLLCAFYGCKFKAMALTSFCQLHILSDPKQQLYKACDYVIKSAQAGPITCGKPILRSTVPSLCKAHFQKAQKHVTQALKKAGLIVSSSNKPAPKFHVIVAEYVREIQGKRKAALKANGRMIKCFLENEAKMNLSGRGPLMSWIFYWAYISGAWKKIQVDGKEYEEEEKGSGVSVISFR